MPDDKTFPQSLPVKLWTDAKILFFHFNSSNGGFASLPMKRTLVTFGESFKGIPGTKHDIAARKWRVPGYQCLCCAKVFFSSDRDGLKHECMKNGGIISESASMGA